VQLDVEQGDPAKLARPGHNPVVLARPRVRGRLATVWKTRLFDDLVCVSWAEGAMGLPVCALVARRGGCWRSRSWSGWPTGYAARPPSAGPAQCPWGGRRGRSGGGLAQHRWFEGTDRRARSGCRALTSSSLLHKTLGPGPRVRRRRERFLPGPRAVHRNRKLGPPGYARPSRRPGDTDQWLPLPCGSPSLPDHSGPGGPADVDDGPAGERAGGSLMPHAACMRLSLGW
jgi:hypothetical protein